MFLGTPQAINDTWIKASGAKMVEILGTGGGAGAGNGRSTATAAGGGAGGGGGFLRKLFRAEDLAATMTVSAGLGGAGGVSAGTGASDLGRLPGPAQ